MKEDKISILQSSPVSLLESTRKDFESLLSHSCSTDEEKSKQRKSRGRRRRRNKEDKNAENVEMVEVASVPDENREQHLSGAAGNSAFWYEREDEGVESNPSSQSIQISRKSSRSSVRSQESESQHSSNQTVIHQSLETRDGNKSDHDQSSNDSDGSELSDFAEKSASQSSPATSSIKASEKELKHMEHDILSITVHQLDQLFLEPPNTRPMVVIHLVNIETGKYIKSDGMPVPPQLTGSWLPQENALCRPTWNQELFFYFDVATYLPETLLIFEILSEPSANEHNMAYQLAWAFLRPISRMGTKHVGQKLQLQLYRVPIRRFLQRSKTNVFDIFTWFQNARKEKYPSSLYITLKQIPQYLNRNNVLCSYQESLNQDIAKASPLQRRRLSGQPVKLPTRKVVGFKAEVGSMMASFCPEGSFLAVAFIDGRIYNYQLGKAGVYQELKGHRGNIYDLHWFNYTQQSHLLSSGADCTARLWNTSSGSCLILPHPAYVYGARFKDSGHVATACYDQLVRLWKWSQDSMELIESYDQHQSPVNCLVWDRQERLFTGDTSGQICVWKYNDSRLELKMSFCGSGEEMTSNAVNWLCVHPSGNRLLSHCRANHLWMIEPLTGMKLTSYDGIYNPKLRLTSTISPCGNYVLAGSEDGSVHWFDLERGDLVAILSFDGAYPVTAITFHPTDHLMAICSLNPEESFIILEYKREDTQVQGFSLVTLPRTVRSALPPPREKTVNQQHDPPHFNDTPYLDRLQRIFRKLDLVRSWSQSNRDGTGPIP